MTKPIGETWLDRVIGWFSPEAEYRRLAWRGATEALRNYDAGASSRLHPWLPTNASGEETDRSYRDTLRARARDLERNNDACQSALGAIIRNVVGTGIRPQARVRFGNGRFNDAVNDRLEELWKTWIAPERCDISGQSTFYELQGLALLRKIVDGDIFFNLVTPRGELVPLQLQGLEVDYLDTSHDTVDFQASGRKTISGIEVNDYYRPLAYWFQMQSEFASLGQAKRIPAENVIHLWRRFRFSQIRGVSELAAVILRMRETGEYLDAELVAARIAACFALFITKTSPGREVGRLTADDDGKRIETLSPGMIKYLNIGETVQTASPGRNATTVKDFIEIEDRRIAAALGLSYEVLSRDMSRTNYSSARQNHLEDRRTFQPMQEFLITHFCRPVWRRFVEACVLAGLVNLPGYWSNPDRYHTCDWIAPGWTWIDPVKDVKARKEELRAGLSTLARTCAENGEDWQELIDQRAREIEYARAKGVNLDIDQPTKGGDGVGGGDGESDGESAAQE